VDVENQPYLHEEGLAENTLEHHLWLPLAPGAGCLFSSCTDVVFTMFIMGDIIKTKHK
jgi:hypothetical protein